MIIIFNVIFSIIKSLVLAEIIKEWWEYYCDSKLSRELDSLMLMMDNPNRMAEDHTNAYLLCKERIETFNRVAKRLRERGFNREADTVEGFVDRINSKDKVAVKGKNRLVSARLCLISYKGIDPAFEIRIKLGSLKDDYASVNQLSIR